jgi:hypothetical protein
LWYIFAIMLKRLAILAIVLASAWGLEPVPGQIADTVSKQSHISKSNPQNKQPNPSATAASGQLIATPASKEQSESEHNEHAQRSVRIIELPPVTVAHDRIDYIAVTCTVALAIIGFFGVLYARRTLADIKRQADTMDNYAKESRATTAKTIEIAQRAADAAHLSALTVIDSERAWLGVSMAGTTLPPVGRDPNQLEIFWLSPIVQNFGRTPGRLTKMYVRPRLCKSITELPCPPIYERENEDDPSNDGSGYFEGDAMIFPVSQASPVRVGMSRDDVRSIQLGEKMLYLYGYIDYEIIAEPRRTSRKTRFSFLYNIPGGFSPIPESFLIAGPPGYNEAT